MNEEATKTAHETLLRNRIEVSTVCVTGKNGGLSNLTTHRQVRSPLQQNSYGTNTGGQRMDITTVNFTWAIPGGLWTARKGGATKWEDFPSLLKELGKTELSRIIDIATKDGFIGIWKNVPSPSQQPPAEPTIF
jgi:hypothetical protein